MSYCPKCGSPVGANDRFCNRCGNALAPPPPNQQSTLSSRYPPKPSTNFGLGVLIGAGFTLLIIGSLIAFSVNGIYNQQINLLMAQGVQVNQYVFFDGLVLWISGGIFLAVYGVFFSVLGLLNQFSVTVRNAMNLKDGRARWGNGLITGGFVFTALSINNTVTQFYRTSFRSGYPNLGVNLTLVAVGLVLILSGVLLFRSAYLRSQHKFTR